MVKVLVVAPHPDDETLGCGGSLLKHSQAGDSIHWLIVTDTRNDQSFSKEFRENRLREINNVKDMFNFDEVKIFNFFPTTLDQLPKAELIGKFNEYFQELEPNIVYLPYGGDAHSDHKVVFEAAVACTKSFRNPSVKSVRIYETLSETDFGFNPDNNGFKPNLFIDIEDQLDKKIEILNIYASELKEPPFPRSEKAVRALALLRGQIAGTIAAESYMLLKEIK